MKKVNLLAAAVLAASMSAPAFADYTPNAYFNGMVRAGVGMDKNGHTNAAYTNQVGRLGNESRLFGEIGIGADVAKVDDTVWTVNSMLGVATDDEGVWVGASDSLAFRQFNVEVKGLFDADKDAKLWVGKKYVQREDIHITDTYYYDISGNGAGIENVSLGAGKFSFAYVQNTRENNTFDVRYNFPLWDGASFQVGNAYTQIKNNVTEKTSYELAKHTFVNTYGKYAIFVDDSNGNFVPKKKTEVEKKSVESVQQTNGNTLTLEFSQGFNGGWNKTVYQWFTGANAEALNVYPNGNKNNTRGNAHKVYNFGEMSFGNFHVAHVVSASTQNYHNVAKGSDDGEKIKAFQIVVRPWYQLTKMTKLVTEFGIYGKYTKDKKSGDTKETERAKKATVAYAICPDASSIMSRPEIRFYATWLNGKTLNADGSYKSGVTGTKGKKEGSTDVTVGVMATAWW